MQFNSARTFSFLCFHSFSMFLLLGESNPGHPAYDVGIPQSSFVIMRLYSSHSSLPSVACPLPSSQPSPNGRLPVAVHCLGSNGAPQRRQPGSSIVNASWRHDSRLATTHHNFPPPPLRSSSFRSLLQTFAFRSPSAVWDPMAHHNVANLEAPSSTLLGVTTLHHSFPPPALRSNLRFAAFSKRSPSSGRPPSGIHARQVFSEPYKTRVPSRPLFPAVASNSVKK